MRAADSCQRTQGTGEHVGLGYYSTEDHRASQDAIGTAEH